MEEMRTKLEKAFNKPVRIVDFNKNGVDVKGFEIDTGNRVRPVIYPEMIKNDDELEKVVKSVNDSIKQNKHLFDKFDNITKDELLSKVRLCIRKHTKDDTPKKDILNLELYVRLIEEEYSASIGRYLMESFDISEDELFENAENNTEYKIADIYDIIPIGLPNQMIVITSTDSKYGASCIGDSDTFDKVCNMFSSDRVLIFPSSIHEVIAVRYDGNSNSKEFMDMVKMINEADVAPDAVLSDNVYVYDRITKNFEIL